MMLISSADVFVLLFYTSQPQDKRVLMSKQSLRVQSLLLATWICALGDGSCLIQLIGLFALVHVKT